MISMTQYKADFPFPVLFPQQTMDNVLAEWLGKLNVPQMHVAGITITTTTTSSSIATTDITTDSPINHKKKRKNMHM